MNPYEQPEWCFLCDHAPDDCECEICPQCGMIIDDPLERIEQGREKPTFVCRCPHED